MRGFAAIGLYAPKTEANVGGAFRACQCYGASLIVVEGARVKRYATDTMKAWRSIPLLRAPLMDSIPFDCVPVVVELVDDAQPLHTFQHPQRAFYIFGPEDGSVPGRIVERATRKVSVPTQRCMNLAATVNVVLYDRLAKQLLASTQKAQAAE